MRFEFHPEALAEYKHAARFYAECQDGLELRFIASVETAIRSILIDPQRRFVLEEGIRRCLTKVFPYAVLYSIETDYILIIAVMHCHREPSCWRNRISSGQS